MPTQVIQAQHNLTSNQSGGLATYQLRHHMITINKHEDDEQTNKIDNLREGKEKLGVN